jgi:hypothetical protein
MRKYLLILFMIVTILIVSIFQILAATDATEPVFNPNSYYKIINRSTGKYLDNAGSTADGYNVKQYSSSTSNNQQWKIIQSDTGYFRIICRNGGKALDNMGSTADGANMAQWSLGSSYNQQWQIVDQGNNYFKIICRTGGKCLDTGGLTADGSVVQQWGSGSSDNQQWQIVQYTNSGYKNPVLPGLYADPEIACFNGTYYIYPTTDGYSGWSSSAFKCFSSTDLVNWTDKGVILDLVPNISWSDSGAWAPCIVQKDNTYYYYFTASAQIGVATSTSPTGPFVDALGAPLLTTNQYNCQSIDPDVFIDDDGQAYMYFGQGKCMVAKLNSDMKSFATTPTEITPSGYNEGSNVFKRNGTYYLMWSENDTRSEDYRVAYATATSPMGPFTKAANSPILAKNTSLGILGTGHHSILKIPNSDEWYICYHRFAIPGGDGMHREVCIDKMYFNTDRTIKNVVPTLNGITSAVSP